MNSKKIKIITALIISVFLLSTVYFLSAIIISSSKGTKVSQDSFSKITKEITQLSDDYGILTETFLTKTEELLSKEEYLNAITIQKDNVVFYAYPISSKLLRADERGNAYISSSSPLTKVFTKNEFLLNGDNLIFSVAYNTVLPEEVYRVGKITFIIILACTFITILFIISLGGKKNEEQDEEKNHQMNLEKELNFQEVESENVNEIETTLENVNEHIEENIEHNQQNQEDSDLLDTEEIQESQNHIDEKTSEEIIPKFTEKNDPMGLFSDITGFGWESYFETRLDAELVRATSSEQDASLFIITLPELNKRSQAAEEIYQVILDFFKYRDMIFEYKNDSFAGIHINMNLENAINYAEQLFINLYSIYEAHGLTSKIGIGITTRSMRLVPGNRLISEAEQAAEKALEEETMPIVAFKVNHEKYREYVSEEA